MNEKDNNYFDNKLSEALDNFRLAVNNLDFAITGLLNEVENYKTVSTRKFLKCNYCKRVYLSSNGYDDSYCSKECKHLQCEEKSSPFLKQFR